MMNDLKINMNKKDCTHLYHYTSVDAFEKMLREMQRKNSRELTFWASNIHYMNDPNEMSFLYDELIEALPEMESHLNIKEMPFSMFCSLGKNQGNVSVDLLMDIKDNVFNKIFKSAFAISFTKKKDNLSMWSLYGNNGSGLCLEFDYEALKKHFSESASLSFATRFEELHYYIKEVPIWVKIAAFYKLYHDKPSLQDNPLRTCRDFIARVLLEMAPILKHQAYADEKEVRLLYHVILPGDADEIVSKADVRPMDKNYPKIENPKVRVRNGMLIPYKEISIPIDCITKIIVGPTLYPQLQSEALNVLLREVGIEKDMVAISDIPYRQI